MKNFRLPLLALSLLTCASAPVAPGQSLSPSLLTTLTNPTPGNLDYFGWSVAAVGTDRVLVGAPLNSTGALNTGAAHLFHIDGSLLATITNPFPQNSDFFGWSVAALGKDRLLIAAAQDNFSRQYSGEAYLFSSNGTRLATFTKPNRSDGDYFGIAMAPLGSDRVLIGAYQDDAGAPDAGAAYLFNTNGAWLMTFTNPFPAPVDNFGVSVAALGPDRVLVGASGDDTGETDAGAAYLFATNGLLLASFTNPVPGSGDNFGYAVASLGDDRVLVGARYGDIGGPNAGAAYLFDTNGTLLVTFTNPTPTGSDNFGSTIAAVGRNRVLIGAHTDDQGANDAGVAHLFDITGARLATITNPAPSAGEYFGIAVTAAGDRAFIGASWDNVGAPYAGGAFVFSLNSPLPALDVAHHNGTIHVRWPNDEASLILQQADQLGMPASWSNSTDTVTINGWTNSIQQTPPSNVASRFFRLWRP